ncbi:PilZ domain-containing protein [Sphingobium sp. HWE2-09]|uniref:PilZ domain-containing protein n=1 Tax=Sphingobium sp. HWE2-09 TaxID=3108390 RepID=UPI002DC7C6E7|nr:PilZ domain-containing protein [Sphingobium sp. HWE2-09]
MDSIAYRARADRRRESRFSADIGAMLHWDGISQPVTIRNISIYGALLSGTWLPVVGEWVTLIADGLEVCGTVIWEGPDRCGLLLSRPVDPLAVIAELAVHTVDHVPITLRRIGPDQYA